MTPNPDNGCFTCIKITNIVLFSMALITYIIATPFLILALIAIGVAKDDPNNKVDKNELEQARVMLIVMVVVVIISILITIAGLIGAIKEHGKTMLIITILDVVMLVMYFWSHSWICAFFKACVLFLTGYYTYLLLKRSKHTNMTGHVICPPQGISVPQIPMTQLQLNAAPFNGPQYSGSPYPGQQYPGSPYPGAQYSGHPYNGQHYSEPQLSAPPSSAPPLTEKSYIYPQV